MIAVIDLHSRYILNWSVSNSMEAHWCQETMEEAIRLHEKSEIFNTDFSSHFTLEVFTDGMLSRDIKLSMNGKKEELSIMFAYGEE